MTTSDPTGDDADKTPDQDLAFDEKVERLANKLMRGGDGNDPMDIESARRAARRMLEDSEARTAQASELDPDDPDVIRRSSSETAATGESDSRWVSDGD